MKLELNPNEFSLLEQLLLKDLEDTRVEAHHTSNSEFKTDLHNREQVIRGLLERFSVAAR